MGHRKHSAPRRGSLAYRPRGRAKRFVPRVRTWPRLSSGGPVLLGFPSFKAGTIHAITTDDREKTPNFGKPLFNPATVLAVPEAEVVGVRLYARENGGERPIAEWRSNSGNESEKEKIIGGGGGGGVPGGGGAGGGSWFSSGGGGAYKRRHRPPAWWGGGWDR